MEKESLFLTYNIIYENQSYYVRKNEISYEKNGGKAWKNDCKNF